MDVTEEDQTSTFLCVTLAQPNAKYLPFNPAAILS